MTTDQKIIKNKVGLLRLAQELGNVSQACKVMGYSRDSFYRFRELAAHAVYGAKPSHKQATQQVLRCLFGSFKREAAFTRGGLWLSRPVPYD